MKVAVNNPLAMALLYTCAFHVAVSDAVVAAAADDPVAAQRELFEKQVRPLLLEHCAKCHGPEKQEGGLNLSTREALLKGGDSGPAIVPRQPEQSLLVKAIDYRDETKMPPGGKLPAEKIAVLRRWIEAGAAWPQDSPLVRGVPTARGFRITEKQKNWWAFQPIRDAAPPVVRQSDWIRNDLDRFILAKLESAKRSPAPEADRIAWLRRATFDLTGLPPLPEEVDVFVADASEQAFAVVVERLLGSPAYGERWARHWLDVVRYADFHDANPAARTASCEITEAWRYRDWVVNALNRDLPFDQFIVHQIAGDRLPSPTGDEIYPDGLIATTFLSNGVWDRGDADKEKIVSDMVDDNLGVIGKAFLGLTLDCARCHDHKFDPISTEDYYGLAGMFYSSHILKELGTKGGEYTVNRVPLIGPTALARRAQKEKQLADLMARLTPPPPDSPERRELLAQRDAIQKELAQPVPLAMAVTDGGTAGGLFPGIQDVPIHIRGSYARLGPVVPRRLPRFFAGETQSPITQGSGRLELAGWVASPKNPLTARVIVNRFWQWHFGEGLVRTPSNFGLLSEPPSHPELLDWLASRFMADGWSLKRLQRRIMLSATYRQSSRIARETIDQDPENRLVGRFTARRLEAEAIRDAILSASGQLDSTAGGPAGDDFTIRRRSLYVQTARWQRDSYANLFDAANPDSSTEKRGTSTVAPQALLLLNHPWLFQQARHLAERLVREETRDDNARILHAYRLLYGRAPTEAEQAVARRIIAEGDPKVPHGGWVDLAHVLLCSNEFAYLD